ncbi:MAG: SDR family NAD(P)-dependent oxidoreductase [Chitinophagales bacterium]
MHSTSAISGKWALVTGASSGIGRAIAEKLAQLHWNLFLVSNQLIPLQETAKSFQDLYGVACIAHEADLTCDDAVIDILNCLKTQQIEIEFLVNNAGMLLFAEVVAANAVKRNQILKLHVNAPVALCAAIGEGMKGRRSGYILNVSSISAVMPYPGISLYGPTKTFMRYFTRALRSEMAGYQVRVTCLIPGATATALYDPEKIDLGLAKRFRIMQTPEFVAQKAVAATIKNQSECIPGILNRLTVWLVPLIPHGLIIWIKNHTKLFDIGLSHLG